jgi:hypothetical protein
MMCDADFEGDQFTEWVAGYMKKEEHCGSSLKHLLLRSLSLTGSGADPIIA